MNFLLFSNCILFLFFLFCPLSILWASYWSGEWSGRATERSNFTSIYGTLSLALQQTDSEYSLEEGVFSSKGVQKKWGPDRYTIQEGRLFLDQKEVGSISDSAIHILYEVKNATGTIFIEQMLIRIDAEHLQYQEQYIVNKRVLYGLSGTLTKISP